MKAVSIADMRKMDQEAIEQYSIPSIVLMEHASLALSKYIEARKSKQTKILIVCGSGNNGGDGYALARLLKQHDYPFVEVASCADQQALSKDAYIQYQTVKAYHIKEYKIFDDARFQDALKSCDLVVDAIFGTGLCRDINGPLKDVIEWINQSDKEVISIDIASGIHGDSGKVMGCAVKATTTLTFECMKLGQLLYPGNAYHGNIEILTIDLPKELVASKKGVTIIDDIYMKEHLPKRKQYSHKGCFGKALMIGGSKRMHGALCMAAKACLKSGVGTLTLFVPECIGDVVAEKLDETMIIRAKNDEEGFFAPEAIVELKKHLSEFEYVVIGNGMGRTQACKELVQCVLASDRPCIVDGDALFLIGQCPVYLKRPYPTILTPHIKEMSYLSGYSIPSILEDPIAILNEFLNNYPEITLCLKDAYTWIANRKEMLINMAKNSALAKGGSGDVLCGMIAGLYGQCKQPLIACSCGVYAHARCADDLVTQYDENSILPTMLIDHLQTIYRNYR